MVTLDTNYDDYKRPKFNTERIGIFRTRRAAIIAGVTAAAAYNSEHGAVADEFWEEEAVDASHRNEVVQQNYKKLRVARAEYIKLSRGVCELPLDNDDDVKQFEEAFFVALEDVLKVDCIFKPSGGRPRWELFSVQADDEAVEACKTFWKHEKKEPSSEESKEEEED